jgi:hypothetical protein
MRDGMLILLIASMLFVSMEGVADSVDEASFHQTHHVHADGGGDQWYPDVDGDEHECDTCEHFCHAHVVAMSVQVESVNEAKLHFFVPAASTHTVTYGVEPPSRPPDA